MSDHDHGSKKAHLCILDDTVMRLLKDVEQRLSYYGIPMEFNDRVRFEKDRGKWMLLYENEPLCGQPRDLRATVLNELVDIIEETIAGELQNRIDTREHVVKRAGELLSKWGNTDGRS